jgi:stage II sporulation protein AA (anti-sigma F factor antagonist)
MNITISQHDSISVFALQGRADGGGARELEQALLQANNPRAILDMSQLKYINSAALRILAAALTENRGRGGDLLLAAPPAKIRRVFQIIGFDHFFRIFDSLDAAIKEF